MEIRTIDGRCYGPVADITVTGSPFTWTNPESVPVLVSLAGGTLSTIQLSPDLGATWMTVGLSCGQYRLNPGWSIKVTYILIPSTMQYTPV